MEDVAEGCRFQCCRWPSSSSPEVYHRCMLVWPTTPGSRAATRPTKSSRDMMDRCRARVAFIARRRCAIADGHQVSDLTLMFVSRRRAPFCAQTASPEATCPERERLRDVMRWTRARSDGCSCASAVRRTRLAFANPGSTPLGRVRRLFRCVVSLAIVSPPAPSPSASPSLHPPCTNTSRRAPPRMLNSASFAEGRRRILQVVLGIRKGWRHPRSGWCRPAEEPLNEWPGPAGSDAASAPRGPRRLSPPPSLASSPHLPRLPSRNALALRPSVPPLASPRLPPLPCLATQAATCGYARRPDRLPCTKLRSTQSV